MGDLGHASLTIVRPCGGAIRSNGAKLGDLPPDRSGSGAEEYRSPTPSASLCDRKPSLTSQPPAPPASPASPPPKFHAGGLVNAAVVLGLLYLGREVLVPITLAVILSLLIAPLVRKLRRFARSQVTAVLGAVCVLTILVCGLGTIIVSQVVAMAEGLPQYESTIRDKLQTVQSVTLGRVMQGEAGRMMSRLGQDATTAAVPERGTLQGAPLTASGAVPVEVRPRPQTPVEVISHLFSSIWGPLGRVSIVLIVMVFVLLEHESLRDRFIRLLGGSDLRRTTQAFNDAGERLSRFFVSQLAVNVGVGVVIWLGLMLVGLPHALLWAVLTALLRFVPYVGVFIAAGSAALMSAAVDPGWTLTLEVLGLFAAVELVSSQVVEPQLYGHSTGLSPLSVVVAAIFWSWIGGPRPAGVHAADAVPGGGRPPHQGARLPGRAAGRHAGAVHVGALLPARDVRRRGGDRGGRAHLPQAQVLRALLRQDPAAGAATGRRRPRQAQHHAAAAGDGQEHRRARHRGAGHRRLPALVPQPARLGADETSIGVHLRRQREIAFGQHQGPLAVAPGSVALCLGLGSMRDDLVTELLVRILRAQDMDARHLSLDDLGQGPPPGASADGVAMLFIVTAARPRSGRAGRHPAGVARALRRRGVRGPAARGRVPGGRRARWISSCIRSRRRPPGRGALREAGEGLVPTSVKHCTRTAGPPGTGRARAGRAKAPLNCRRRVIARCPPPPNRRY